jgi:hypothetical protein
MVKKQIESIQAQLDDNKFAVGKYRAWETEDADIA